MAKIQCFLLAVLVAHIVATFVVGDDGSSGIGSGSSGNDAATKATPLTSSTSSVTASTTASKRVHAAKVAGTRAAKVATPTTTLPPSTTSTTMPSSTEAGTATSTIAILPSPSLLSNKYFIAAVAAGVWALVASIAALFWQRRASAVKFQLELRTTSNRRSRAQQQKEQERGKTTTKSSRTTLNSQASTTTPTPKPSNRPASVCATPTVLATTTTATSAAPSSFTQKEFERPSRPFSFPSAAAGNFNNIKSPKITANNYKWNTTVDESPRYVDLEEITIDGVAATVAAAWTTTVSSTTTTMPTMLVKRCNYVQPGEGGQRCKRNAASGTDGAGYCTKHTCPSFGCPNSKPSLEVLCEVCVSPPSPPSPTPLGLELYEVPCTQAPSIYDAARTLAAAPAVSTPTAAAPAVATVAAAAAKGGHGEDDGVISSDSEVYDIDNDGSSLLPHVCTNTSNSKDGDDGNTTDAPAYPLLGMMMHNYNHTESSKTTGKEKEGWGMRAFSANDVAGEDEGDYADDDDDDDMIADNNNGFFVEDDGVYGVMFHAGIASIDDANDDLEL